MPISLRHSLLLLLLLGLFGCVPEQGVRPDASSGQAAAPVDPYPITLTEVWYRAEQVGLSGKGKKSFGELVVRRDAIEYRHSEGKVAIPAASLVEISQRKLPPDIANQWVVVKYRDGGKESLAGFKAAVFAKETTDKQIYSTLLPLLPKH